MTHHPKRSRPNGPPPQDEKFSIAYWAKTYPLSAADLQEVERERALKARGKKGRGKPE